MVAGFTYNEFSMILERGIVLRFKEWTKFINSARGIEKHFLQELISLAGISEYRNNPSDLNLLNAAEVSITFNENLIQQIRVDVARKRLNRIEEVGVLEPGVFVTETDDIRFKEWIKNLSTSFYDAEKFFETEIFLCKKFLEEDTAYETPYYNKDLLSVLEMEYYVVCTNKRTATSFNNSQKTLMNALPSLPDKQQSSNYPGVTVRRILKSDKVEEVYKALNDYFDNTEHKTLRDLLMVGYSHSAPITFKGKAIQLADSFKQLHGGNIILGLSKKELEEWILQNFRYTKKKKPQNFSPTYLNSIFSTSRDNCKSPIINVKNGQVLSS